MRFLFWNTKGKALVSSISRLAAKPGAEVVYLTENPSSPTTIVAALDAATGQNFRHVPSPQCNVTAYTSIAPAMARRVRYGQRYLILQLTTGNNGVVIAVAVHLPSKLRYSVSTQRKVASDLSEEIRRIERSRKANGSFLIGDVNMNPFDPGMIEADALNAVSARKVAEDGSRRVNGKNYPMFFNPMWSHMGDGTGGPPGSFYRRTTDNDCIFFHTLDQVLIRPALQPLLAPTSIRIITNDGVDDLVSPRGVPRKKIFSDHLPIHLELNL